jgi:hypothetical protein
MTSRILLGMLTPSSNTVLEPVTTALIRDITSQAFNDCKRHVLSLIREESALAHADALALA